MLEVGFDDTTPNKPITISSWALDKAFSIYPNSYIDNRAIEVKCYIPEFTFVEKLQAIATKFRKYKESDKIEKNFMRHYYDVYCLLKMPDVQNFLETPGYKKRNNERFPKIDNPEQLRTNPAYSLENKADFELFKSAFESTKNLYYKGQLPNFPKVYQPNFHVSVPLVKLWKMILKPYHLNDGQSLPFANAKS